MEVKLSGWGRRPMPTILEVTRGHPRSNPYSLLYGRSNPYSLSYGSQTWWVGSLPDVKHFGGQFKVIRVTQGQIRTVCRRVAKLGGWGRRPMPTILEVSSSVL